MKNDDSANCDAPQAVEKNEPRIRTVRLGVHSHNFLPVAASCTTAKVTVCDGYPLRQSIATASTNLRRP